MRALGWSAKGEGCQVTCGVKAAGLAYTPLVPFTGGFTDADELRRHYFNHGRKLNCVSSLAYEARADAFMGGPIGADVAECTRPLGDLVRYNQVTQEFGVLRPDRVIRTYLILDGTLVRNRTRFCANCVRQQS